MPEASVPVISRLFGIICEISRLFSPTAILAYSPCDFLSMVSSLATSETIRLRNYLDDRLYLVLSARQHASPSSSSAGGC